MEQEFLMLTTQDITLGVSWSVFGNADRSDLDDLLTTNNIHGAARLTVVDLWKRHPSRPVSGGVQGKTVLELVTLGNPDKVIDLRILRKLNLNVTFVRTILDTQNPELAASLYEQQVKSLNTATKMNLSDQGFTFAGYVRNNVCLQLAFEGALPCAIKKVTNSEDILRLNALIALVPPLWSHPHIIPMSRVQIRSDFSLYRMPLCLLSFDEYTGVSLEVALKVIRDIGEALDYMHNRGYAHSDVKPANICCNVHAGVPDFVLVDLDSTALIGKSTYCTEMCIPRGIDCKMVAQGVVIASPVVDWGMLACSVYIASDQQVGMSARIPKGTILQYFTESWPAVADFFAAKGFV